MKRVIVGICLFGAALASGAAAAKAPASLFDAPANVKTVVLHETKDTPKTTITCSYYAHFMVKQVDEGEVGAAQLSVVPIEASSKPACQRDNLATEKITKPEEWAGYFKGVKGDFVFLDAADGINGAMGFAIVTTDAKKLFDDVVLGKFKSVAADAGTLTLTYQRSFAGPCSVAKDGAACWTKIAAATGVKPDTQPDCAGGYLRAKNEMAKARCEADKTPTKACIAKALKELDAQKWDESPSVITYDAQTVIASGKPTTTALGGALSCHPAD